MISSQPRIGVVGSGANGSSIAVDLATAGFDVTLIEQWPEHVAAIREHGLRIEMPGETVTASLPAHHLCEVCSVRERFDLLLLVMKAYDTVWAAHLVKDLLKDDGVVVGVQNGMTTRTLADVVGADRVLGCVIEISAVLKGPGVVSRHSPPGRSWFAVGAVDDRAAPFAQPVADVMGCAGTTEVSEEIEAAKWMKLVSNCSTLVPMAILGVPMVRTLEIAGMREVMIEAGQEAFELGHRLGYQRLPIYGLTAEDLSGGRVPELLLDTICGGFILPETSTTVLYDWNQGRRSEAGDVNGLVVREAIRLEGRAPVNENLMEIAGRIEAGELRPDPANAELMRS